MQIALIELQEQYSTSWVGILFRSRDIAASQGIMYSPLLNYLWHVIFPEMKRISILDRFLIEVIHRLAATQQAHKSLWKLIFIDL